MYDSHQVCDGFDVHTDVCVLHFDHDPTDAEIKSAIELFRILATQQDLAPIEPV